jgi:4-hydroxythreonine-4-phosphate dehydrogenase
MGDPCGVGPEIVVKALEHTVSGRCLPLVIGDPRALERAVAVCGSSVAFQEVGAPEEARRVPGQRVPLLALSRLAEEDIRYGRPTAAAGDAVYRYICAAARLCLEGTAAAMATAPISKEAMHRAGHDYPGHTELLAELCGSDEYVMMLAGEVLRVSLVTIHEALKDVPALIGFKQVLKTIRVTAAGVSRLTGKQRPRLAVAALNPHCGEGGMFGREESDIIAPAIAAAQRAGIDAVGPLSADTLFYFARQGQFDGVVAMYHDQGLIPLKMLHFDDAVNITLGLPIIRTSVDHGTAYDLAGSGRASEKSMLAAITMALDMAGR